MLPCISYAGSCFRTLLFPAPFVAVLKAFSHFIVGSVMIKELRQPIQRPVTGFLLFHVLSTRCKMQAFRYWHRASRLVSNARAGLVLKPLRPWGSGMKCFVTEPCNIVSEMEGNAFGYLLMYTNESGRYGQLTLSA